LTTLSPHMQRLINKPLLKRSPQRFAPLATSEELGNIDEVGEMQ
jgi:hypothetical protein